MLIRYTVGMIKNKKLIHTVLLFLITMFWGWGQSFVFVLTSDAIREESFSKTSLTSKKEFNGWISYISLDRRLF